MKSNTTLFRYPGDGLSDCDVAKEREARVFAVGLTGMNARLDQDDGFAFCFCDCRRERARFRGDYQRQFPALPAKAKAFVLDD